MSASVQFRPRKRDLGMAVREVDQDLAIFLGLTVGENESNTRLSVERTVEFDNSTKQEADRLWTSIASWPENGYTAPCDDFISSEIDTPNSDWAATQHNASLLPSLEDRSQHSMATHKTSEALNGECITLACNASLVSVITSTTVDSCIPVSVDNNSRRPLSSGYQKPKPFRSSTPKSRPTIPPSKPIPAGTRSSTPAKPVSRSSTPAGRPSKQVISPKSRLIPTPSIHHKPVIPLISSTSRPSLVKRTSTTMSSSRGTSPVLKSRPSTPLSQSQDPIRTLNPKAPVPRRSASTSRVRSNEPTSHLSSPVGKPEQLSRFPAAKVRSGPHAAAHKTGLVMPSRTRGRSNEENGVNPVLIGTEMVERVVNMRKLAPRKQVENLSHDSRRKSSQESSGFGRSLSKSSLEMAIRHMDIGRSLPGNIRQVATRASPSSKSRSMNGDSIYSSSYRDSSS